MSSTIPTCSWTGPYLPNSPIIGGVLSRPADRWPDTLGSVALLREYPYFLPCAVASAIAFISFAICSISLEEVSQVVAIDCPVLTEVKTLTSAKEVPLKRRISRLFSRTSRVDEPLLADSSHAEYGSVRDNLTAAATATPKPKVSELAAPAFICVIANIGFLAFIDMANAALLPLVYSTPIEYGGLGLEPYHIGILMSTAGITNGVLQTMFIGRVVRRFGCKTVYIVCFHTFLVSFATFPIANAFATRAGHVDWKTACVMAIQLVSLLFVGPCYSKPHSELGPAFHPLTFLVAGAMYLLIIEKTPSTNLLGSANAIAQMSTSGMRAFGPTIATSLFAISHQRHLAGGHFVYIALLTLTVIGILGARRLPDSSR
jgi:hypothetical protein